MLSCDLKGADSLLFETILKIWGFFVHKFDFCVVDNGHWSSSHCRLTAAAAAAATYNNKPLNMPQKAPKRIAVRRKHSVPFPYVMKKRVFDENDVTTRTPLSKSRRCESTTTERTPMVDSTNNNNIGVNDM